MIGRLHSVQSLGTVDGPGVRAVAFLSGCPLRCACCHNPDTWDMRGGEEIEAPALAERLLRFRRYFGQDGGVTLSGGEPLLQAEFAAELFRILHTEGVHTALDTSGCLPITPEIKALLAETDYVLLDIKYDNGEDYRRYAGCDITHPMAFLKYLCKVGITTRLRRVVIPTLTDSPESADALASLARHYPNVDRVELLPMRKLCVSKYREMGIAFPLEHLPEPTKELMDMLSARIAASERSLHERKET